MISVPSASGDIEDPRVVFVMDLAKALHAYGMPAHRLETVLSGVGEQLELSVHLFTTPTAIFAAFGDPPHQRTYLVTPRQRELDLGRLSDLDELVVEVAEGRMSPAKGSQRVRAILARRPFYPPWSRLLAFALLACTVAFSLGGNRMDAAVASLAGLAVGLAEIIAERSEAFGRLMLPIGATLCATVAGLGTLIQPTLAVTVVAISGMILLVPGLTLTIAMTEVATGHLVSGTVRLSKALVAFLLLGFGAALGGELTGLIPGVTSGRPPAAAVPWVAWLAIAGSIPSLMVFLEARAKDVGWIATAVFLAYVAGLAGSQLAGREIGAGLATLALGLAGNAFARFRRRPAALLITPGILLLVPGALGFRSVRSFLDENVLVAVSSAFDVALVAIALVTGLLIANLALPPRKAL